MVYQYSLPACSSIMSPRFSSTNNIISILSLFSRNKDSGVNRVYSNQSSISLQGKESQEKTRQTSSRHDIRSVIRTSSLRRRCCSRRPSTRCARSGRSSPSIRARPRSCSSSSSTRYTPTSNTDRRHGLTSRVIRVDTALHTHAIGIVGRRAAVSLRAFRHTLVGLVDLEGVGVS